MKIDTSTWKDFALTDYFNVSAGIYYYPDEYEEGATPYISASNTDNGVSAYISLSPDFAGNCITTGKVGCTAFYQPLPFCATSDVNIIRPKFDMHPLVGLFITQVINFNENYRWDYGRQCRVGDTKEIKLKLPATSSGEPDWQWMEDYIRSLHSEPIKTTCSNPKSLDFASWGDFQVKELFDVQYGINMELNACTETDKDDPEAIAFVARTAENNGVSAFVKPEEGKIPQPANTITVAGGGSVLSTFLQVRPFYSGRDLYLLLPKQEMNNYMKLFVVTVLQAEKYRFNYGRQANKTLPDLNLHLPITSDGKPDWQFMENYMKSLPYGDRIDF
jgi:hypothetical protein